MCIRDSYDSDLPAKSGMGSSSSFVVGLLNSLYAFKKKKISKKDLSLKSIYFEQKILKETVGMQDQIACSYGGFNEIKFLSNKKFIVSSLDIKKNHLLLHQAIFHQMLHFLLLDCKAYQLKN